MVVLQLMKDLIAEKKKQNQRVSLRWVAARMKVSSGRLSEILSGKRTLSEPYLEKFCSALKISQVESYNLQRLLQESREGSKSSFGSVLTMSQVESLADWKPFAIMSFLQTTIYQEVCEECTSANDQIKAISKKINLPLSELTNLLTTLQRANLVEWRGSRWYPVHAEVTTGIDIPNEFIKLGHVRRLALAMEKVQAIEAPARDFSSVTLTMNPADMVKAKKMLRAFRRRFSRTMEKGDKQGVYQMNIQLFPLLPAEETGAGVPDMKTNK